MSKMKKLLSSFTALSLALTLLMPFAATTPVFAVDATSESVKLDPASNPIAKKLGKLPQKDWTVAIYLCGTDLEETQGSATSDLIEMLEADIPDNVNVIVMTGGTKLWNPLGEDALAVKEGSIPKGAYVMPDAEHTQLYAITDDKMKLLYTYNDNLDMSETATLAELMEFAIAYAPADHMMFSFWDHGGGPICGAELDSYSGKTLKLPQIGKVMKAGAEARGKKLDLVGYDCCLMACLENAWILSDAADYLLASEEAEPGCGWMYHWLSIFSEKKKVTAVDIGKRVIDLYPTETENGWMDSTELTMSLTDLSKIPALVDAIDKMGKELNDALNDPEKYALIAREAEQVHSMLGGRYGVSDLYDLAYALSDILPSAADVIEALGTNPMSLLGSVPGDGALVYRGVTLDYQDCAGLTVYYPVIDTVIGDEEQQGKRKDIYRQIGLSESYADYIETITSKTDVLQSFSGNLLVYYDDDSAKIFAYAEDPESLISLKMFTMQVHYIDKSNGGETVYVLGEMPVDSHWDENRFYGELPSEWLSLNGEIFSYNTKESSIGDAVLELPILIDGKDTLSYMKVIELDGRYLIDSIVDIDENGQPGRSYEPDDGMVFSTVLMEFGDEEKYRVNTPFTVGGLQEVEFMGAKIEIHTLDLRSKQLVGGANAAYDSYFCGYDMKDNPHLTEPVRSFMVEDASELHMEAIPPQIYNGKAVEPTPVILFADEPDPVMIDDEFTITYENNEQPGTATIIVDFVDSVTGVSGRLTADFEICKVGEIFADVPEDAPYIEALSYLYSNGIVKGTDENSFSPDSTLTRAMVTRLFHKIMAEPAPASTESFTDVEQGQWYTDSVCWAKETGIVSGMPDGSFAPNQSVTREQLSVMLAKFAQYVYLDTSSEPFGNIYRNYTDAALIDDYAFETIRWACGNGMLTAVSEGRLAPLDAATRAQTVEAIYRFILKAKDK